MFNLNFIMNLERKIIVTGHYGSGKTEFVVSAASQMKSRDDRYDSLAVIDLDIINPYFRSREQREMLSNAGIDVYGSVFDTEVTAELPALSANIRKPLEDKSCRVITDAGGNDTGAVVLNQFNKYFTEDTTVLAVINSNRPDTCSVEGAIDHIRSIEYITKLNVSAIINNSHMLRDTRPDDIKEGHMFCKEICDLTGKYLLCDCYPQGIVNPDDLIGLSENLIPMGLYMRPTWLDS